MGALFLAKVPHDLQTKLLMSSRFKKIKPDTNFSFSLKSPGKRTPLHLLQQGPYGESYLFTGSFLHTSLIPHNNFPK